MLRQNPGIVLGGFIEGCGAVADLPAPLAHTVGREMRTPTVRYTYWSRDAHTNHGPHHRPQVGREMRTPTPSSRTLPRWSRDAHTNGQ